MKTGPGKNLTLLLVAVSRGQDPSVCRSLIIRISYTYPLLLQTSTSFNIATECLLCAAVAGRESVRARGCGLKEASELT